MKRLLCSAINKEKSDLIMLEGTSAGAKYDDEYESSKPVNGEHVAISNDVVGDVDLAQVGDDSKIVNMKTVKSSAGTSVGAALKNWSYYFYSDSNGWDGAGDIFISTYTSTIGSVPVADLGHAALGGDSRSTTIEILGGGYKVQWYTDNWFKPRGGGLYEADRANGAWAWYRVRGASISQYQAAKNYAHNNIKGAPYNWNFYTYSTTWSYYCSEVVHFAWLRGSGKFVSNGLGNMQIAPYGLGPQNKYNATYLYRGDLSSKGGNR